MNVIIKKGETGSLKICVLRYFVYISISVVLQDKDSEWQVKPCCTENVMFIPMSRKSEEMRW